MEKLYHSEIWVRESVITKEVNSPFGCCVWNTESLTGFSRKCGDHGGNARKTSFWLDHRWVTAASNPHTGVIIKVALGMEIVLGNLLGKPKYQLRNPVLLAGDKESLLNSRKFTEKMYPDLFKMYALWSRW
ncbi:hypothetical protein MTR67_025075 [Solanum verrucosum]|uniref:Uncharacterized protein n=1 Tax=Solanum verrucosum TaxID=315347 RepID=A0AAF0TYP0_SOLVR|nr:hypothetical protein MTR67_025075 [Solanum verrucosum]